MNVMETKLRKKYSLYYAGFDKGKMEEQIGVATSLDMATWKYETELPIIPLESQGMYDKSQTSNPCVLEHNGVYKMWYQGKSETGLISVCYAESPDGISWKAHDKSILSPKNSLSPDFREGYHHPHVIFDTDTNTFKMWCIVYHEGLTSIGFCDSVNGLIWTEMQLTNLVSTEKMLKYFYPFVMKENGLYRMWFTERIASGTWQLCYVESNDGLEWKQKVENPILAPARAHIVAKFFEAVAKLFGVFAEVPIYGIGSPFVWKEEEKYFLIGHEVGPRGKLYIPLYESTDGLSWKKIKNNILPEPTTSWNKFFQADPYIYVKQ